MTHPAIGMKLADIRIDGGTQLRHEIDESVVADYAEAIIQGAVFPPAVVFEDGADYWLAEGFHRYHAHRKAKRTDMRVEIHLGTKREAVLFAAAANAGHGLQRNAEDKRKAVITLLADPEWGQWGDREIAQRCHVAHSFVAKVRRERDEVTGLESSDTRKYTDKHGNTSAMKVKKAKTPAQLAKEAASADADQAAADAAPTPDETLKLLEQTNQHNAELLAQIEALTKDDTKAELAKQLKLNKVHERSLGDAMTANRNQQRELERFGAWFKELRKLTRSDTNQEAMRAIRSAFSKAA